MSKAKREGFFLNVNDFLTSKDVLAMTAEEVGGYILLLMFMWKESDCMLEADYELLARLSRLDKGWFNGDELSKSASKIVKCFSRKKNKFFSKRLQKEHKNYMNFLKSQSEKGKKSGKARRNKGLPDEPDMNRGSTTVEPEHEPNVNRNEPTVTSNSNSNSNSKEDKNNYADFVKLTSDEYQKLKEKFGEDGTKERISRLNNYKASKGKKYKSDYHTILVWETKNNKGEQSNEGFGRNSGEYPVDLQ